MTYSKFDRDRLYFRKLRERVNQISIEECLVSPDQQPVNLSPDDRRLIRKTSQKIIAARKRRKPVILAFGAHTIKNGLADVLNRLIREDRLTHLATNGAGIIHDWEFAFQGKSGEDVRKNVDNGSFGIWEETGFFINLALVAGAYQGLGYGESIGKMISDEGLTIPATDTLIREAGAKIEMDPELSAAAIDFSGIIRKYDIKPGFLTIEHPWKRYSIQCSAYELNIPFTGHPMFGHDIIYTHPLNHGASIGRTALTDFLRFAGSISRIEEGVYISLGSSVMSPMIFEKALSMAQNIAIQQGSHINNHFILVADLARTDWDWSEKGEPPSDNPSYYIRYCKTFNRMGGEMQYLRADNKDFLLQLYHDLKEEEK